jgi:hypothetical protein
LAIRAANFQAGHERKHEFGVKEYEDFHEVLHPLQHDALPRKNFEAIRGKSTLLLKRGAAIVKLGAPRRVADANKDEFATELEKFRKALARLRSDARKGTDAQLQASFSAVHDSFEMLVAMLPRE